MITANVVVGVDSPSQTNLLRYAYERVVVRGEEGWVCWQRSDSSYNQSSNKTEKQYSREALLVEAMNIMYV